jgi:hypothetical protein
MATETDEEVLLADAFGAVAPSGPDSESEGEDGEVSALEMSFGTGVAKRTVLVTQGITVNDFVRSSR